MSINNAFILPHPPLVIPEIGKGEENKISQTITGFKNISRMISKIKPETIIVVTPHSQIYSNYFNLSSGIAGKGSFSKFGASKIKLNVYYDNDLIEEIISISNIYSFPAGTLGVQNDKLDHGTLVPLYYVNKAYTGYKLVRASISGLSLFDHYRFGKILEQASKNLSKNTILIASGDLSHRLTPDGPYGFSSKGKIFDEKISKIIKSTDFLDFFNFKKDFLDEVAECGLRSFVVLAGAFDGQNVSSQLMSLEGPFGVGYLTASFKALETNKQRHFDKSYFEILSKKYINNQNEEFPQIARFALTNYLLTGRKDILSLKVKKDLFEMKAAVFVTIYLNGNLRGCIGTLEPRYDNIVQEITKNSISAGTKDPRFPPIGLEELDKITFSVDVLSKPEDINSIDDLNPKKFGVIITSKEKTGVLLPNINGINTVNEQINIAKQKAGISDNESYLLQRFKVRRYNENKM